MSVLVTGAGGYAGRYLSVALARSGVPVIAVGRTRRSLEGLPAQPGLRTVAWDLADPPPTRLPAFSAVIHAAAHAPPRLETPSLLLRDNILATDNLIRVARTRGAAAFLFLSSISVYGDIRAARVDESTEIRNPGPYGQSKLFCEALLAEHAATLPSLSLRLPALVGLGATTPWLARVLAALRKGRAVKLFNPGAPFNNAVAMDDLVVFLDAVLKCPMAGCDTLTLAAAGSTTVLEAVETLAQTAGLTAELVTEPSERGSFVIDSGKAQRAYGYRPSSILDIIRAFGAGSRRA